MLKDIDGKCKSGQTKVRVMTAVCSTAAGFLFARGIAGAALCAGWSMTAVVGRSSGAMLCALLFAAGCLTVCTVEEEYGFSSRRITTWITAAAYVLWQITACSAVSSLVLPSVADTLAVVAALLTLSGGGIAVPDMFLAAAAVVLRAAVSFPAGEQTTLKIQALCCTLASAGMAGTALCRLTAGDFDAQWLLAGAAAGLL